MSAQGRNRAKASIPKADLPNSRQGWEAEADLTIRDVDCDHGWFARVVRPDREAGKLRGNGDFDQRVQLSVADHQSAGRSGDFTAEG